MNSPGAATAMSADSHRAKQVASDKVSVFISYAHADIGIARALSEVLLEINRDRVVCFLDTQSIQSGQPFLDPLNEALETADWLICIYTGEQSEFCGYEIGVFSKVNGLLPGAGDSRLVCLHDVQPLPVVFQSHQNRLVIFPPETTSTAEPFNDVEFYTASPIATFFNDFYKYKGLYTTRDAAEAQRQLQTQVRQVKRITDAFIAARGSHVRADSPTQLRVEISVASARDVKLTKIPAGAEVAGTFQSLALFGLAPPMQVGRLPITTWGSIRDACGSEYRRIPPWMERLEQDMLDSGNGLVLSGLEATFSAKEKIYRTILARHILFENGNHKFEVLFVETLPRQFLGKKKSSLILAGIVLASRFRFAYFEDPNVLAEKFSDKVPDSEFESNCWQLCYDLDRLGHEAVELGLLDPKEFIKSFGEDNRGFAEELMKTSAESRDRLLSALPTPGERIEQQNRAKVRDAIFAYFHAVEPVNSRFLTTAINVYRQELATQLGNSGGDADAN